MGETTTPRTAADAFMEASPSGGTDLQLSEDAQARAMAQHAADAAGPAEPPAKKSILSTTYPAGPNAPGIPWDASYEFPGATMQTNVPAAIGGAITGDSSVRHPEIPALNIADLLGTDNAFFDPRAWRIAGNMALTRDPAAVERNIQSIVPEAKFDYGDEVGPDGKPLPGANRQVQVPGGPRMYLDRPGVTPQKGLFYGPQTLAAVMSDGRSLPAQMGLGGLQHALSTLGSYELGGESSPYDILGTAISALAPGALGTVGAGLIKGYDYLTSEVRAPAADAIKKLGVEGLSAAQQAAANIADRAKTLYKFGFAGKPGDITGDPATLAAEDLATNAGPPGARALMDEFHRKNAQTVLTNKRQIIGETAGDVAPGTKVPDDYQPNESTFGNRVNDAVIARDSELDAAKKAAWQKMGPISPDTPAGKSLVFSPDVAGDIMTQAKGVLRDRYGQPQGPGGTYTSAQLGDTGSLPVNAVDQMRRILEADTGKLDPNVYREFNLGHLQDIRQTLGNVMDEQPRTSPAFAAAARLKRIVDDAVSAAETTPGRLRGDPESLANFRDANAATRAHYAFRNPEDNPAAGSLLDGILNRDAPFTGQETVSRVLGGGGTVTPGGGTNATLTHLQTHLGDDATKPLAAATTMRSLYGTKGTTQEGLAAPPRYDYDSTANRIHSQIAGTGDDVADRLLTPEARARLGDFRDALNILGASNRKAGPRLNAPGSGYIGMMTSELPFGVGGLVDKIRLSQAAKNATQGGAELVNRAVGGANTAAELQVRLPRQSTIQAIDPQNPFYSWQPGAWRAGTPAYRGGGLLGEEALNPENYPRK